MPRAANVSCRPDSLLSAACGVVAPAGGGRVTWLWLWLWLLQVPTEGAV